MKKILTLSLLAFFLSTSMQAQFLKKLQQKVEKRVEDVVTDKVADKAAAQASASMDNLLNVQLKNSGFLTGIEQVDAAEVPEKYVFDHTYVMQIKTEDGELPMTYLLKKDAPYFGMKMHTDEDMYMVMDAENKLTVMYMSSGDTNFMTATRMPEAEEDSIVQKTSKEEEYTFKQLPDKKIMGYNCKGFQAEDEGSVMTFYVTKEAEVSFTDIYKNEKTQIPKGFDPKWMEDAEGLMMEMTLNNKKDQKQNMSMTCVALEKQTTTINKNDFTGLGGQ